MIKEIVQSIKLYFHRKEEFYGLSFKQLHFIPKDHSLYKLALIHRSASVINKEGNRLNNERLEYLGDAVLSTIFADIAYTKFPDANEGFLTQLRSKIVSRKSLNQLAINIGLDKAVIAGSNLNGNKHIYGDVFEAFIGAMYIDQGFENTQRFIAEYIFPNFFDLDDLVNNNVNYKSQLIEWAQKNKKALQFDTGENSHHSRRFKFICNIIIDNEKQGSGVGSSKKEAEQNAAHHVLAILTDMLNDNAIEN